MVAAVWAIELLENYVCGVKFQVISDHKALASVLKPNRSNEIFSSRLERWVDRLLPFEFELIHAPVRVLGFADYLSRKPSEIKGSVVKSEKVWNGWFTANTITKNDTISENETTLLEAPRAMILPPAPESVLRVKIEQDAQEAKKAEKRKSNQSIESQERNARTTERKFSAVQNMRAKKT